MVLSNILLFLPVVTWRNDSPFRLAHVFSYGWLKKTSAARFHEAAMDHQKIQVPNVELLSTS